MVVAHGGGTDARGGKRWLARGEEFFRISAIDVLLVQGTTPVLREGSVVGLLTPPTVSGVGDEGSAGSDTASVGRDLQRACATCDAL